MNQKIKDLILAILVIIICAGITALVTGIIYKNKMDLKNAKPAVILENNVNFYKSAKLENVKIHKELNLGTHVYILENFKTEDGTEWCKVYFNNKKGYILKSQLGYYEASNEEMILMADVSKFNKTYNFETSGEFAVFLVQNKIDCVYIRAGGRGYGEKGNFYYDECYEMWAKECEFLQIPFGFYFLDEALNSEEIDEEVEFIKKFLIDNDYEYAKLPVALDIENHDGKGRADDIWENRAPLVSELIEDLEDENIKTIVYSNAKTASQYLSSVNTKFWLAYYPSLKGKIPDYWYSETEQESAKNEELMKKMIGWQFTENGVGDVIKDKVDISLVYSDFLEVKDVRK